MKYTLRIAGIEEESIVDGPGIRLVVFAQGCSHRCKGCHNPESWSHDGGQMMAIDHILSIASDNPLLDGLTLSGGEPFEQGKGFAKLAKEAKDMGLNIVTYTGYTYEEIIANIDSNKGWEDLLKATDILIDGPFDITQKSMLLKFMGSKNQRIIDVKKSLNIGNVVLANI
ncbi:MAG: anaerobic ribonucleoside-triphosphate reductase activating protein [Clostridiales bacterium]|nr:anaerobic ribonucleoside-triphosphate reductase activating protein [Clostridiales bacterium]